MGSGLQFLVPCKNIPANIYTWIRTIAVILYVSEMKVKKTHFKEHGLAQPIDLIKLHRDDAPWITPCASVPIRVVPVNISAVAWNDNLDSASGGTGPQWMAK